MVKNVINISLGEKIDINKTTQKHAGIQFVTYLNHESAKVKIEMLKNNEGLVRFLLSDKKFNKLENSLDRWGYFICISNNRNGLLKMLEV